MSGVLTTRLEDLVERAAKREIAGRGQPADLASDGVAAGVSGSRSQKLTENVPF